MKPRYSVDLAAHIADCELNYQRIRKLLLAMKGADRLSFGMPGSVLQLAVTERSPYTTTLTLSQLNANLPDMPAPSLQVRVYHDASLAEVIACQGVRRPAPRCDYPNPSMLQRDEKRQWNRFLGEWLRFCLDCGHSVRNPLQSLPL